jgi:hypothetical protein
MLCGEQGHKPSRCPSLRLPPDGFSGGGGGGGGHSHDEDDSLGICGAQLMVAQLIVGRRDWLIRSTDDEFLSKSQARAP